MATKTSSCSSSLSLFSSPLTIEQLIDVLNLLKRCGFPQKRWKGLGLKLGLHKNTLDAIKRNHPGDVSRCLMECLSQWLSRADNVDSKGGATFDSLSDALKSMKENAAADKLDKERLAPPTGTNKPLIEGPKPKLSKLIQFHESSIKGQLEESLPRLDADTIRNANKGMSVLTQEYPSQLHKDRPSEKKGLPLKPVPIAPKQLSQSGRPQPLSTAKELPPLLKNTQSPSTVPESKSLSQSGRPQPLSAKKARPLSLIEEQEPSLTETIPRPRSLSIPFKPQTIKIEIPQAVPKPRPQSLIQLPPIAHNALQAPLTPPIPRKQYLHRSSITKKPPPTAPKPHRSSIIKKPPPPAPKPSRSQNSSSAPHDPTATVLQDKEPHLQSQLMHVEPHSIPTVIQLSSKEEVALRIELLHDQFTDLVTKIRMHFNELVSNDKLKADDVAIHAEEYLGQDLKLSEINISTIFTAIEPHCDFCNFGLLKSLVYRFIPSSDSLQTELAEYIDSVKKFSESSQLKHIQSTIKEKLSSLPAAASPTTSDQTKPVVIQLSDRWDEMAISKLKRVFQHYINHEDDFITFTVGSVVKPVTTSTVNSLGMPFDKEPWQNSTVHILPTDHSAISATMDKHQKWWQDNELTQKLQKKLQEQIQTSSSLMKQKESALTEKEELQKKIDDLQQELDLLQLKSHKKVSVLDKEVQFNYLVPSQDNLEGLSECQIAGKKLFLVQGDKPQLMNWEEYGLRISVPEDSLSASETVEVSVLALVGGHFKFPDNTRLVSAVYAISTSPLLKSLRIEMQHCIDLSDPSLSKYLKFAVAPVHTASLPYQFSLIEGGEFPACQRYGWIERSKFCQLAIVGKEEEENGGGRNEERNGQEDEDSGDEGKGQKEGQGAGGQEGEPSGVGVEHQQQKENNKKQIDLQKEEHGNALLGSESKLLKQEAVSTHSTGIPEATVYAGQVFYQRDESRDLMIFTAAKDLNPLRQYIRKEHSHPEFDQSIKFKLTSSPKGCIELIFNDKHQTELITGWKIKPHLMPCQIEEEDILSFGDICTTIPPSCLVSIYAENSPHTVPNLSYSVPLKGVQKSKEIVINRSLKTKSSSDPVTNNRSPPSAPPPPSNSTFRGDIAHRVMTECTSSIKDCGIDINFLVDKLLEHKIVNSREKRKITAKETDDDKIDELLHIILSSIRMNEKVFGIFIDILREEDTLRTIALADTLMDKYKE